MVIKKSAKEKIKKNIKKTTGKVKEVAQKGKEQINEARKTSTWKKIKRVAKKVARITGSHLAVLSTSVALSNEESELLSKLESKLKKRKRFASKSQILRAGLWKLSKVNGRELEEAVKDLMEIKQTKIL